MTEIVILLYCVVGNDFCEFHRLSFRYDVSFCFRLPCKDEEIGRNGSDSDIRTLDPECFRFRVYFLQGVVAVDYRSEIIPGAFDIFSFDQKINLMSKLDLYVVLSKEFVEVARIMFSVGF